jgi:dGTPase
VESADDICYLIVDIEDAYKSKKITFAKAEGFLKAIAAGHLNRYHLVFTDDDRIAYLRAKAIGVLAGQAFKAFWDNDEEICRGRFTGSLLDYVSSADTIREIRTFAREELYTDPRKLEAEVAGFEVIRGLLEFYCETHQSWETTGRQLAKMPERYRRAIRLLPNYVSLPATKYQWLLRITDYVSGMTDRFAVKQFRNLKGIRLGLDRILFNAALAQNKCLLFWRKAFAVHPGKRGISTAH